jgi:hypothetical protein
MTIFWTLKSIPELADLSARDRRVRWRRAYRRTWRHWENWIALIAWATFAGAASRLGTLVGHPFVGVMIGSGIGGFAFGQVPVHVARSRYKSVLLGRDN